MLTWPKSPDKIAGLNDANSTFRDSLKPGGLLENMLAEKGREMMISGIPFGEVSWIQNAFVRFNEANGYPRDVGLGDPSRVQDRPNFAETD